MNNTHYFRKAMMLFALFSIAAFVNAGGGSPDAKSVIDSFSISKPTTYLGVVKHTNTANSDWFISLFPDNTFNYSRTEVSSQSDAAVEYGLGKWAFDAHTATLTLEHGREKPLRFLVTESGGLSWFDPDQVNDSGILKDSGAFSFIDLEGLTLSGMMTYMADAANIELCQTGLTYPVDPVEDYLALEQNYLADVAEPAEPMLVFFEGRLAMRVPMEGDVRQMLVVDKFLRTEPAYDCEGKLTEERRMITLIDTYWLIEKVYDTQIVKEEFARAEPHMLLEEGDTPGYSIFVGCNRMRGGFEVSGNNLTLSPMMSTRMACPSPMDEYEKLVAQATDNVASYEIVDRTLRLLDANGKVLMTLSNPEP